MRLAPIALPVLLSLSLAACGGSDKASDPSPGNFVPPATQPPAPLPGQRQSTPLTNYVGHHPNDAVDGVGFYDRSEVASLLVDLVPEEELRHTITGREATTVPIARIGSRIAAHGCEPDNCTDRNWTVLVSADGHLDRGTVCYHDAASMGNASRWTTRAGAERRPGECPQN